MQQQNWIFEEHCELLLSCKKKNQFNFIKMLKFSTLKWFSQSQLDRLSITWKFINSDRKVTFSFDPEKARLFEPPIKCISIEKPLTGVWVTVQNCLCSTVVNRLLRWRKPLINSLHYNKNNEVNHAFEIRTCIPSCSSLIILSVIWIFGSTPTSHEWYWDKYDAFLPTYLDWWYLLKYKWKQ